MSLSDTDVKSKYNGDGATTTFAIPFPEIEEYDDEVEVVTIDESTTPPTETVKTLTTHYTITGTNVIFGVAPASTLKVLVSKKMNLVQSTFDGDPNGAYPALDAEEMYDRMVNMMQILDEKMQRAPKWRKSYVTNVNPLLPDPVAAKCIVWNSAATGFENGPTTTDISGAAASATAAAASAAAAATSASSASTSATNAATSATNAAASAAAAAASAAAVVAQGPFTIANNQAAPANITNFILLDTSNIGTYAFRYSRGSLGGVARLVFYKNGAGTWVVAPPLEDGDPSGMTFTLVLSGLYQQVQYTSDNTGAGTAYWVGSSI